MNYRVTAKPTGEEMATITLDPHAKFVRSLLGYARSCFAVKRSRERTAARATLPVSRSA